jgi:hypothetical protein
MVFHRQTVERARLCGKSRYLHLQARVRAQCFTSTGIPLYVLHDKLGCFPQHSIPKWRQHFYYAKWGDNFHLRRARRHERSSLASSGALTSPPPHQLHVLDRPRESSTHHRLRLLWRHLLLYQRKNLKGVLK